MLTPTADREDENVDMKLELVVLPVTDVDQLTGLDPARQDYGSFAAFSDPDGNGWLLQEVTTRVPGR